MTGLLESTSVCVSWMHNRSQSVVWHSCGRMSYLFFIIPLIFMLIIVRVGSAKSPLLIAFGFLPCSRNSVVEELAGVRIIGFGFRLYRFCRGSFLAAVSAICQFWEMYWYYSSLLSRGDFSRDKEAWLGLAPPKCFMSTLSNHATLSKVLLVSILTYSVIIRYILGGCWHTEMLRRIRF